MLIKDIQENYGDGWIKVYRSTRKHWVWRNPLYFKMWIDFLFRANHKEKKILMDATIITIKRGEFITSQVKLAKEHNTSRGKIRRFLELLENDLMIEQKTTSKFTKIIICNYDSYQDSQPTDNQRTTSEQPANNPPTDTNKNVKNDKNVKKREEPTHPLALFISKELKNVSRLELQLSDEDCTRLLKEYDKKIIKEVLYDMENKKDLTKKYKSVNLTLRKWIKIRLGSNGTDKKTFNENPLPNIVDNDG